jgi:hypothetical protein
MDSEHFQVWSLKFIDEVNKCQTPYDTCLLLVDGHSSQLNEVTLFNFAVNRVVVLVGPFQFMNAWQANDARFNKAVKENIKKIMAQHVEYRLSVSFGDFALFILDIMVIPNISHSI